MVALRETLQCANLGEDDSDAERACQLVGSGAKRCLVRKSFDDLLLVTPPPSRIGPRHRRLGRSKREVPQPHRSTAPNWRPRTPHHTSLYSDATPTNSEADTHDGWSRHTTVLYATPRFPMGEPLDATRRTIARAARLNIENTSQDVFFGGFVFTRTLRNATHTNATLQVRNTRTRY